MNGSDRLLPALFMPAWNGNLMQLRTRHYRSAAVLAAIFAALATRRPARSYMQGIGQYYSGGPIRYLTVTDDDCRPEVPREASSR